MTSGILRHLLLTVLLLGMPLAAATTATWELGTYSDFLRGRFTGVSLTRDGRLTLAPQLNLLFSPDQPAIWSAVRGPDGSLYLGTGHRGRVYRVSPSGRGTLLWTAEQPEVFALALAPDGTLYAGTSPDGRVYRIRNGQATEFYNPNARYIWSLTVGPDGSLYVGTGDQGHIHRVRPNGQGEVHYDTGQAHVTALALDGQGRLLAGTEPNGLLYRVTAKDQAFVLQDASLPEIRSILPQPDGSVYVAALGGSIAQRTQDVGGASGTTPTITAPSVSITVTDQMNAQVGPDPRPKTEATKTLPTAPAATVAAPASPLVDVSGVEKSAVYRIAPDNTVETLWSSREENAYDLVAVGSDLYIGTDAQGRVYRLLPDRSVTLVVQTGEGEATRLLPTTVGLLAATSSLGRLYRIGPEPAPLGTYESPVHDVGTIARWGRLQWRLEAGQPGQVVFRTRSGNSARPDRTWSDWSAPLADPNNSPVSSPNARFLQWKAEFARGAEVPIVRGVALAYLPQNTAPTVRAVTVSSQLGSSASRPAAAADAAGTYSITVSDSPDAGATSAGTPTVTPGRPGAPQIVVSWTGEDPEGDRLLYSVFVRGEGERTWRRLRANLVDASLTLDPDVLADGRYEFRVVASDRGVNAPASAREGEGVGAPVLLDSTPPTVTVSAQSRTRIVVEASDATSPLRRLEYSLNAGLWTPLEPDDSVTDSTRERAVIILDALAAGEHVVVVRAFDSAGNAGLAKVVLR